MESVSAQWTGHWGQCCLLTTGHGSIWQGGLKSIAGKGDSPCNYGSKTPHRPIERRLQKTKKGSCAPRVVSLKAPHQLRSLRLSVRTPGFQPGKRGSIPLGTAIGFSLKYEFGLAKPQCEAIIRSCSQLLIARQENFVSRSDKTPPDGGYFLQCPSPPV